MLGKPLISIIIPVFNGEKYLEKTLFSIQSQSITDFEVLLVDDTSTDSSFAICNDFARKDSRFKVFQKPNGGFVAFSMNYILPKIQGDFVFYSSQDDLFSEDLLEKMVARQLETNADSVLPDMEFFNEGKNYNKKIIGLYSDRNVVLSGKEACNYSLKWEIPGFSLTKTALFENLFFPENAFDSDEFITRKLLLESKIVAFSSGTFFYRQDNPNAITKTFTQKNFYSILTKKAVRDLFLEHDLANKFQSQIMVFQMYLYLRHNYSIFTFSSTNEKKEIRNLLSIFKNELGSFSSLKSTLKNAKGLFIVKTCYMWLKIRLFIIK
jgi:glycosyltransferase involved in cell wall biosynthesis